MRFPRGKVDHPGVWSWWRQPVRQMGLDAGLAPWLERYLDANEELEIGSWGSVFLVQVSELLGALFDALSIGRSDRT